MIACDNVGTGVALIEVCCCIELRLLVMFNGKVPICRFLVSHQCSNQSTMRAGGRVLPLFHYVHQSCQCINNPRYTSKFGHKVDLIYLIGLLYKAVVFCKRPLTNLSVRSLYNTNVLIM